MKGFTFILFFTLYMQVSAQNKISLDSLLNIKKIELDSLYQVFNSKSKILKKKILDNVNVDSIPLYGYFNYNDPAKQFSNILKSGDKESFDNFMIKEILYHENFDFGPYALFMAESRNSSDGHYYVWLSYITKNKNRKAIKRDRYICLENLGDDEKSLAYASLIKAAQARRSGAISSLADCYRYGLLGNKDTDYADCLIKAEF